MRAFLDLDTDDGVRRGELRLLEQPPEGEPATLVIGTGEHAHFGRHVVVDRLPPDVVDR
jgi:hypothetical protein